MAQQLTTVQTLSELQLQRLTPQQLLNVQIVEMSIADLEQRVRTELDDNDALEEGAGIQNDTGDTDDYSDSYSESYSADSDTDAYTENYDYSLDGIQSFDYSPDDVPIYSGNRSAESEREQLPLGGTVSFIEDLTSQMMDYDLTEHQQALLTYLIGSLSDRGFIEQPLEVLADEMLFSHNIETDEHELEEALSILQQFEPAGIGARNHRECFLIQIDRKLAEENISESKAQSLRLQRRIIADEYDAFRNKNIDRLADRLSLDRHAVLYAISEITRLNYNPGSPLSESSSDRAQTILPDFIVETDGENVVSIRLNNDSLPSFHISSEYRDLALQYQKLGSKMREREKQQLAYCKKKYDAAQMFVEAIAQRNHTLMVTMKALADMQRKFFVSQDTSDLVNLIYKDVAERVKLDISTISRVCQSKYASIDGRIYPLSIFFKHNRKNAQGEDVDSDAVAEAIRRVVDSEDKNNPYSDIQISEQLKKQGINVARRTVRNYRDSLAIPPSLKRKR